MLDLPTPPAPTMSSRASGGRCDLANASLSVISGKPSLVPKASDET